METSRNEFLWRKAKKRAAFKAHLRSYVLVIGGLWIIYGLTTQQHWGHYSYPWPIWPMFGWGIGLLSHYLSAYEDYNPKKSVEIEYEKLLREEK